MLDMRQRKSKKCAVKNDKGTIHMYEIGRIMNINVLLCGTTRWTFENSAVEAVGHFLIVIYFERKKNIYRRRRQYKAIFVLSNGIAQMNTTLHLTLR